MCFFFSSRRRHTRSYGDWSSDVCSSDLSAREVLRFWLTGVYAYGGVRGRVAHEPEVVRSFVAARSEERRVGKECRSRWWRCESKEKKRNGTACGHGAIERT